MSDIISNARCGCGVLHASRGEITKLLCLAAQVHMIMYLYQKVKRNKNVETTLIAIFLALKDSTPK